MKRIVAPMLVIVLLASGCRAIYDPDDYDYTVGENVNRELGQMAEKAGTNELLYVHATNDSLQARFRLGDEVLYMKPVNDPMPEPAERIDIGINYADLNLGQLIDALRIDDVMQCPEEQFVYEHMPYDVGYIQHWCAGSIAASYWADDLAPIKWYQDDAAEMQEVFNRLTQGGPTRGRRVEFSSYPKIGTSVEMVDAELNVIGLDLLTSARILATDYGRDETRPFWLADVDVDSMYACATRLGAEYSSTNWSINAYEGNDGMYYITIVDGAPRAIHTDTDCVRIES